MLRWMLRVDSWLDVASLENVEEDHSFLFLKKNLMKIFYFFFWIWKTWIFRRNWKFSNLEILNFFKELKILIDDFFFESNLRSTSPMPLVPRPFLKISSFFFYFLFFYFFLKILEILNFFMELKFLIDDFFLKNWIFSRNWKFWIFFFERNLRSTSLMPLVPRPFFKILSLFFFLKYEDLFIIKKVKKMKMKME